MSITQALNNPTDAPPAPPPNRGRLFLPSAVPCLIALLLLAPSFCWVLLDRSVWPWDQAYYGEVTTELYYTLIHQKRAWPAAMTAAIPSKPPGLTWLGQFFVPLGQAIGSIDLGLHIPILLLQGVTLVLIYRIGRELSPTRGALVGLAGCALVAAAPLFVGMSHQYMVEPLQTLAVAWFFYIALFSPRWGRLQILSHLVAATAVALLAKTTSPLFCLLPGMMATFQLLCRRPRVDGRANYLALGGRLAALALGLGLLAWTVVWYRANWGEVCHHAYLAAVSDVALQYGHKGAFVQKFAYWFTALQEGLFTTPVFWMATFLTLVGVAAWASRLRRAEWFRLPSAANCLALLAAVHVAAVLASFSFTIGEDPRFLTPALPGVAVLLMWAAAQVPMRAAGVVILTVALVQWGYVHSITLGLTDWKSNCWLWPVERDPGHRDEVTRLVELTSGDRETAEQYNIIGVEAPWCNANSFAYYAAKNRLAVRQRAYFTSLGYAETDVNRALSRLNTIKPVYFIALEEAAPTTPPNYLNLIDAPVLDRLREDDRYARIPFPSNLGVVVLKRTPH